MYRPRSCVHQAGVRPHHSRSSVYAGVHRLANLNNELDALKRERAVVAQQSESTKTAVAEATAKYEKELARVSALQKRTVRPCGALQ